MSKPVIVGITGGIGSGKSIICKIFNHLGVKSYDSDSKAKTIMQSDSDLVAKLKQEFGEDVYINDKLDRKKLGAIVFNNNEKLQLLNSLVHPAVANDFNNWVEENSNEPILLKEAALLVETDSYKELDHLIVVTAPIDIRINRVIKRDTHRSKEELEKIISNQLDDTKKIEVADFVIKNDESELLITQVTQILNKVKSI